VAPLVSHIVPTYERPERHPALYACFCDSRWPNKELLVADDSRTPSSFFGGLEDPRVRYWTRPRAPRSAASGTSSWGMLMGK
jgi:hypothetical protein